jgi:hypothetical protein
MHGDKCGSFTLDENGTKDVRDEGLGVIAADCWGK